MLDGLSFLTRSRAFCKEGRKGVTINVSSFKWNMTSSCDVKFKAQGRNFGLFLIILYKRENSNYYVITF